MKSIINICQDKHSDFEKLVDNIQQTNNILQQEIFVAINKATTCRAWLTGFYIVEYEQNGKDRAKYGDRLLQKLSQRLGEKSFGLSSLKNYRLFYLYYPDLKNVIIKHLSNNFKNEHFYELETIIKNDKIEEKCKEKGITPYVFYMTCFNSIKHNIIWYFICSIHIYYLHVYLIRI